MLPPGLTITPEILRLIAELDEFKGQWLTPAYDFTGEDLNHGQDFDGVVEVNSFFAPRTPPN